jgi:hypothetical protein
MRRSALRAQQITLAAAVFDKGGRILVDPDGYIPSTVVTDSFLEKVRLDSGQVVANDAEHSRMPRRVSIPATRCSIGCTKHQEIGT